MRKDKSVIVQWILSYIFILLIPIVTIFINYFYNMNVIKKEIYNSNKLVLENFADNVDRYIYEQRSFYTFIVSHKSFATLIKRDEKDVWFYNDVSEVYEQITKYDQWRKRMFGLVYMVGTDYVIGKGGSSSYNYYLSLDRTLQEQIDYVEWKDFLSREYQNEFVVNEYLGNGMDELSIVYANSYYLPRTEKTNIFISVPVSEIEKFVKTLNSDTKLVICSDNEPLLTVSNMGTEEIPLETAYMNGNAAFFETSEYMVVREESSEANLTYYLMIPQRDFWEEFQYLRNLFSTSLVLTLLVGIFCVSVLVKRNFKPLSSLHVKITGGEKKGNEFWEIESAYSKLMEEKKVMQKKIHAGEKALKEYYLLSLMKGRSTWLQGSEENVLVSLTEEESIILVAFLLSNIGKDIREQDDLLTVVLDNVFSDLMKGESYYRMEEGQYLFYLFTTYEPENFKKTCMEKCEYLYNLLKERWGIEIIVAVSGWESEMNHVRILYKAVTEALAYKSLINDGGIIDTHVWLKNKGIMNEIIEYIDTHYMDSSLNIGSVADGIGRNSKYISKVFKDETGIGILDYIHNLRIRKAQIMMKSGEHSLEEISEKVGYVSIMTFRRAFVKVVGVAPGRYKNEEKDFVEK